jgi:hypothetical protein
MGKRENKMTERQRIKLEFRYERKRIKRDKKLPLLCRDFKKKEHSENCALADKCKRATYRGEFSAICYGGAKMSEIRDRKKYLEVIG